MFFNCDHKFDRIFEVSGAASYLTTSKQRNGYFVPFTVQYLL